MQLRSLRPVFFAVVSALCLFPASSAYSLLAPPVAALACSGVQLSSVSTLEVPAGTCGILSPSPAMTLPVQDPGRLTDVFGASRGESPSASSSGISQEGRKSRAKALALSTLLPGAGEYYAGKKGRARFFFLTESAIWTSFIVFEVQGYLRKGTYVDYAELMAGVDAGGKPDDFYRALGRYMRSDPGPESYNEDVRREARALYPDDKQRQDEYLQENGYFGKDAWQWQSEEDQAYYRSLRKKSQLSFRRATYMLGVAVANRILSAMDAARSVSSPAKPAKESQGLRFEMRNDPDSPGHFRVCLTRSF